MDFDFDTALLVGFGGVDIGNPPFGMADQSMHSHSQPPCPDRPDSGRIPRAIGWNRCSYPLRCPPLRQRGDG